MPKKIIIISKEGKMELWGSLTSICEKYKDMQYHTIKKMKFPFTHKGWLFQKSEYNKATNNITK